jgi:16S rRNA (guanine(1405)-N(7))-methyltransferase
VKEVGAEGEREIEAALAAILRSSKYRGLDLCEETIRDLLRAELPVRRRPAEAIQAVRKKLHNIVAAYLGDPDYDVAAAQLAAAFQDPAPAAVRGVCAQIMAAHASTRERLAILHDFYPRIFAHTAAPRSLLDLACGLNPLSFPWMDLPAATRYHAYDIRPRRIALINHYFALQGLEPLAKTQDILAQPPAEPADLALILKEVHRFEQRQRGCTAALLDALRVRYVVVSFPSVSLSGRQDLAASYRGLLAKIIRGRAWRVEELRFEGEIVFCIDKA